MRKGERKREKERKREFTCILLLFQVLNYPIESIGNTLCWCIWPEEEMLENEICLSLFLSFFLILILSRFTLILISIKEQKPPCSYVAFLAVAVSESNVQSMRFALAALDSNRRPRAKTES